MKKILLILTLSLFTITTVSAWKLSWTIVQTDIAVDTVWTKEMSPIRIQWVDDKDKNMMIVNWATLKIESWVKIIMQEWMDFVVTGQCLKWYWSDCYKDSDWNKTYPKLIANWTLESPIIFTWERYYWTKNRWWNFVIQSKWNEIEFVNFEYWWSWVDNYFIRLWKDTIFKNNTIKNIWNNAVFLKNTEFKNNVINNANWNWVVCEKKCEIENVAILNVKWNAIIAKEIDTESYVRNNFIYWNSWDWFELDHYFNKDFDISNNEFIKNWWWVHIYHNNENITINNNNFVKNRDFAIKTDTQDLWLETFAKWNFFNIDIWPQTKKWEFFVSEWVIASDFKVNENDFWLPLYWVAYKYYQNYLDEKSEDTDFFEIFVDRKEIIWKVNQAGWIVEYEFSFKNLKTRTIKDINFEISIPSDQEVILCSVSENNNNYSLQDVCFKSNLSKVKYEWNSLKWKIEAVWALEDWWKINFSTLIKASKKWKNDAKLPNILLKNQWFDKKITYKLSEISVINKKDNFIKKVVVKKSSWNFTKLTRAEIIKRKKEADALNKDEEVINDDVNSEWQLKKEEITEKKEENKNEKPYIETWVIFTKILNWNLYFYLRSTEDWWEYKLLNSSKWEDLVGHIRSENKNKEVRVYWDYYINSYWNKTWIKFNHFHLK